MIWQKKARIAVALAGVGMAGVVFFAVGTRENRVIQPPPTRLDPKAMIESSGAILQQVRGTKEDYEIKAQRQLTYEGGATKSFDVEINVRGREGRDFLMTAREARGGEKNSTIEISGAVTLKASDGFVVTTEKATFNDVDGIVRAAGALAFHRGGMSGGGVGMTYDKNNDVLTILEEAHVALVDEGGSTTMEFSGGGATLTRREHVLRVERNVHATRGEQVLEGDTARALLTEDDEEITYIELRGNSRVVGGSTAFDSMSATDIDLDYTDDGARLERVVLKGSGAIALTGQGGQPGRQFFGDTLNIGLAADNAVTSLAGEGNVRLDLPARKGTPRRSITARTVDARSQTNKSLDTATFSDRVEYQEAPATSGAAPRVVKSRTLRATLADEAISSATFSGAVTFTEQGLEAGAARAEYDPDAGRLQLAGAEQGRSPYVSDRDISISADTIDVTLEGHHMTGKGSVKTTLQPRKPGTDGKLPGLLKSEQSASVNAGMVQYDGAKGRAAYAGDVLLRQEDTAIRSDRMTIDRESGDLVAASDAPLGARTNLPMDNGMSIGRAQEIRYTDSRREIEYRSVIGAPVAPAASASALRATADKPAAPVAPAPLAPPVAPAALAQLSGPQGDLRGSRIVMLLQKETSQINRLEAYEQITLKLDTRLATGARLTYHAADERYVMSGAAAMPVKVVEQCRETSGKTLTFFKTADRIIVDGNDEIRTQTKSGGGPCPEPRSP